MNLLGLYAEDSIGHSGETARSFEIESGARRLNLTQEALYGV